MFSNIHRTIYLFAASNPFLLSDYANDSAANEINKIELAMYKVLILNRGDIPRFKKIKHYNHSTENERLRKLLFDLHFMNVDQIIKILLSDTNVSEDVLKFYLEENEAPLDNKKVALEMYQYYTEHFE